MKKLLVGSLFLFSGCVIITDQKDAGNGEDSALAMGDAAVQVIPDGGGADPGNCPPCAQPPAGCDYEYYDCHGCGPLVCADAGQEPDAGDAAVVVVPDGGPGSPDAT